MISMYSNIIFASLSVALVSLIGVVTLFVEEKTINRLIPVFISLAIGVLLGDAFIHLLPEAIEQEKEYSYVFGTCLAGILIFYMIEQLFHWHHCHENVELKEKTGNQYESYVYMSLLGDGVHNFVDGILIAGSFLVDTKLGITTTIAIIIHEIPQEISDIAVLLKGGLNRRKAVLFNFLNALSCIAGAIFIIMFGKLYELNVALLLAFTAGGFIYIAMTDLIPILKRTGIEISFPKQFTSTVLGIFIMQIIIFIEK
jgi:zinc and cadmium transporter